MKLLIEKIQDLRNLYINQLRVLLSAEEQILAGLDDMRDAASDPQLKGAFLSHWQETKVHITRLRHGLDHTAGEADELKCKAVSALIHEADEFTKELHYGPLRDVALIAAAQRVEHYQIAAYGTARNFARTMQLSGDAEALDQTLQEEQHADLLLSGIADRINHEAMNPA